MCLSILLVDSQFRLLMWTVDFHVDLDSSSRVLHRCVVKGHQLVRTESPMDSLFSTCDRKKVDDAITILENLRNRNLTSVSMGGEQGGAQQRSNREV